MSIWTLKAVPSICVTLSWSTFSLTFSKRLSLPRVSEKTPTTLLQVIWTFSLLRVWEKSSKSLTRTASWISSERSQSWSPVRHPVAACTQALIAGESSNQRIVMQEVCSMERHHRPRMCIKWFNSSTDMTANCFRTDRLKKFAWVQSKANRSKVLFSTILNSETCQMFNLWSNLVGLTQESLVRSAKDTRRTRHRATRQHSSRAAAVWQLPHSTAVIAEPEATTTRPTTHPNNQVTESAPLINQACHLQQATIVDLMSSEVTIIMHVSTAEFDDKKMNDTLIMTTLYKSNHNCDNVCKKSKNETHWYD